MKFLNIDFHISVIEDVRAFLVPMGHQVDSLSLSAHTWVLGRQRDRVPSLASMSFSSFGQRDCDRFHTAEKDRLAEYDGFIVTHSPCLAGLYERTGKPVVCVVSTRYNQFCHTPESRAWLDAILQRMHASGQLILIANNAYDAWHVGEHLGIMPMLIPSLCDYTGRKWFGGESPILHGKYRVEGIRRLPKGHTWQDVARASCCVVIPYNVSLMSVFERHSMGMPMIFPSRRWLMENPEGLSELRNRAKPTPQEVEKACELADWYCGELLGITFFDHLSDIPEMLTKGVPPTHGAEDRAARIHALWRNVTDGLTLREN